jgi:hypothetical protein
MTHENCGVLEPEKHGAVTPVTSLPRFSPDTPRRKIVVTIEVPEDWEQRLDMQWCIEREIHADRWSWNWPEPKLPLGAIADALLALDRIATRVPEYPPHWDEQSVRGNEARRNGNGHTECVQIARRVLRELPIGVFEQAIAAAKATLPKSGLSK